MNQKEYEILAGVIHRSGFIKDPNKIRQDAKAKMLRLIVTDLCATLAHEYPATFDEAKFLKAAGL